MDELTFDFLNVADVESVCSILSGINSKIDLRSGYESYEHMISTGDTVYLLDETELGHLFNIEYVANKMKTDEEYRLKEKPENIDLTIVITTDDDLKYLDYNSIAEYQSQGKQLAIHTPSKLLAPFPNVWYTFDYNEPWMFDSYRDVNKRSLEGLHNPVTIGVNHLQNIPMLVLNPEQRLTIERDEQYISALHTANNIKVLDYFGKFAVELEGCEAELL